MASGSRTGPPRHPEGGFTLVEMMVALAILVFGISALAGSLFTGVGMRRGSEMRFRADALASRAFYRIQEEELARRSRELKGFTVEEPPGYPGMGYSFEPVRDLERPGLFLARVRVFWLEQGEAMSETFERIMIQRRPMSQRIAGADGDGREDDRQQDNRPKDNR